MVELEPGVLYRWYVSIGDPGESRSKDDIDGSFIAARKPGEGLVRSWYDDFADLYEHYTEGDRLRYLKMADEAGFGERPMASRP